MILSNYGRKPSQLVKHIKHKYKPLKLFNEILKSYLIHPFTIKPPSEAPSFVVKATFPSWHGGKKCVKKLKCIPYLKNTKRVHVENITGEETSIRANYEIHQVF